MNKSDLARRRRQLDRAKLPKVIPLDFPHRECGGCTACCTVLAVESIGKPCMQQCQHELLQIGCAVYEDRPEECRAYACAYRLGHPSVTVRPDKCGVIFDQLTVPGSAGHRWAAVNAREAYRGAADEQPARDIVLALSERQPVIVVNERQQQSRLAGPPEVCLAMLKDSKAESELGNEHAGRYLQKVISKVEALISENS